MSAISPDSMGQWYRLLKEVLADIRGQTFRNRQEQLDRYKLLYDSTRAIHIDYIKVLTRFRDNIQSAEDNTGFVKALEIFKKNRTVNAGDRTLTKLEAKSYLDLKNDIAERRFLVSIIAYFYYNMDRVRYCSDINQADNLLLSADFSQREAGWISVSTLLWLSINSNGEKNNALEHINAVISSVGERFSTIEKTYSELEGNWRYSKPLSTSRIMEFLLKKRDQASESPSDR